jgi:integrase
LAGQAANQAAARRAFDDYRSRRADNTLRRQDADLALFAEYLADVEIEAGDLAFDPEAWAGITWGIVEGFARWQLRQGYAIGSLNVRLTTAKVYAGLASKAGVIEPGEAVLIRAVKGYSQKEARRIDQRRPVNRVGRKKARAVLLTRDQANVLKNQPGNTGQRRRDRLLMCLLLDHGLRCGEVAGLQVDDIDLAEGQMNFYRPKVDRRQIHQLTPDTLQAATHYFRLDAPERGSVLRGSRKGGALGDPGMSEQAITARVALLGRQIGVTGLSAHDCRHYWATTAARNGTDPFSLQEAGGWSSLAMPRRYVEAAKVANQGVNLGHCPGPEGGTYE